MRQWFRRLLLGDPPSLPAEYEPDVADFLALLHWAEIDFTATELADVLWLAGHITPTPNTPVHGLSESEPEETEHLSPMEISETGKQPRKHRSTSQGRENGARSSVEAAVYARVGQGGVAGAARSFRAPAVQDLPDALGLNRALRLLHRKVASRHRLMLNEAASVEQLAQQRLARRQAWLPVFQPIPERWFDLALVIDQGLSMEIWQPMLTELRRLFSYNGAFRSVSTWYLDTDGDEARLLSGGTPEFARTCQPEALRSPDGRRLILVVSDCVSHAWHTGSVNQMLRLWSESSPLAVLNMLPPRMWRGTALGRGEETRLWGSLPGLPSAQLTDDRLPMPRDWEDGKRGERDESVSGLRLPMLFLDPEVIQSWSALLRGVKGIWVTGVRFDETVKFVSRDSEVSGPVHSALSAEERARRFFAQASPQARKLAGYLAAAPLTLPVIREVQRVMLPGSTQVHLAEVFLGGLLRRHVGGGSEGLSSLYDFHEGVRELLLDLISIGESAEVLGRVSDFVAARTSSVLDFRMLLRDPSGVGALSLDDESRQYARIASTVLRRFGGEFLGLADRLDGRGGSAPQQVDEAPVGPDGPTPFRDWFKDASHILGPEMIWLPGGTCTIGDDEIGRDNETPAHPVTLSHFAVGKYPVTFEEYDRFCDATNRERPDDSGWGRERRPAIYVSWEDAQAYCQWLSEQTGQQYRLLTEAQWEYACRAGSQSDFCFGDDRELLKEYAWFDEDYSSGSTHPVGEKRPNDWGLFDMHGNVWEWVQDWYGAYSSELQQDPSGSESGVNRVIRGVCWRFPAEGCRSAYRSSLRPGYRDDLVGFRLSRTGPLHSYPFTLSDPDSEPPEIPTYLAGLRDPLSSGSEGPAMVWLRGGVFMMGEDSSEYGDEKPAHEVELGAFSIGQYPVTFEEYDLFCAATGRSKPNDQGWGRGRRPVINVDWEDAQGYCEWLSEQTGERYSLCSEAEWEYACRSDSTTRYCFGDDEAQLGEYAWFGGNSDSKTHPVGEKKPNQWELYDMHGNVDEWVQDWYSDDYYKQSPRVASSGPESGVNRVFRGGSWSDPAEFCRSAYRDRLDPGYRYNFLGFRLSRTGPWPSYPFTLLQEKPPEPEPKRKFKDFEVFRDKPDAPEMVYLPGGTFKRGSEKGLDRERPVHEVTLDAFAVGRYPVTVGEYLRFARTTGRNYPEWLEEGSEYHLETGSSDTYRQLGLSVERGLLPVVGVSWNDARSYCEWLSEQTGEHYGLLTEAEWEYACRSSSIGEYCFGNDSKILEQFAWYDKNSGFTLHDVGLKKANAWGIHDMHGNVWEWVSDCYSSYSSGLRQSPSGAESSVDRIYRGGSWLNSAEHCRSAYRNRYDPGLRSHNLGFRLSRTV